MTYKVILTRELGVNCYELSSLDRLNDKRQISFEIEFGDFHALLLLSAKINNTNLISLSD